MDSFIFWYRWTITFLLVYMGIATHFCISITGLAKLNQLHTLLLYLPTPIFLIKNWTSFFYMKEFVKIDNIWWLSPHPTDIWYYILSVYFTVYTIISLVFLLRWIKRAPTIKKKKQARVMFVTLSVTFVLAMSEGIIMPAFTGYYSFALGPIAIAIWIFGILFCFIKYRFMTPRLEMVSAELSDNLDEIIILLGLNLSVLFINKTAINLFGLSEEEIKQKELKDLIGEWDDIHPELAKLLERGGVSSFACQISIVNPENNAAAADMRFSIIEDKFKDTVGILMIGKEIKTTQKLKSRYGITAREVEIIRQIYQGCSNHTIASHLGITERTVKNHITNIYNKLGVNNKIQLMNLLDEFQLIPQKNADKKLLLL
ncbi:MAG: PAS domain-containing protein [Spirochaetales bacterium]|nr:PAS domain-containing protein [Spirochaetales bacterium]